MKIIAMVLTFNDEDIIEEVIEHLISQGLELVILDNGSTDGTYEICKKFLGHGVLDLYQYSTTGNFKINLPTLFRMLYDMAIVLSPDWVILNASDEILETGVKGLTLKEGITQADAEGYNLIQFDRFDFFMTDNDNESAKSIIEKLTYYSCYGDFVYRSWKYDYGIRTGTVGGHYPIFPDDLKYKISPKKFVMRHYPLRSKQQVERKIKDRNRGIEKELSNNSAIKFVSEKSKKTSSDKIDHKILTRYYGDNNWNYELKYCPLLIQDPLRRVDVFTEDGDLKIRSKSWYQLELILYDIQLNSLEYRVRTKIASIKKSLKLKLFTDN